MRTGRIEETTEANRVAAESTLPRGAWSRTELTRGSRFVETLAELARLLSGATAAPRSAVLAQAAELLGAVIESDRVSIFLAPTLAPASSELSASMEGAIPGREDGLLLAASHSRRGHGLLDRRGPVAASFAPSTGWSRLPSTFQVSCSGPAGLLAVIRFEGSFRDERAQRDLGDRAESAAALVAGYLERDRLERELAALRAERVRTDRLATLGRVASSAAHDLNNVLTAILGYADLLELELPDAGAAGVHAAPAPGQRELDEIRASVERGAALVEDVLSFGRTRTSGVAEIDLADALGRLDGMARRVAGEGIVVSQRVEPGLPPVRLDRERFERVVLNLVANARHAIEACPGLSGRIEISLERIRADVSARQGETLRLRVIDNGCGMGADTTRQIFEPFFTTRSQAGGTGLGLADAADFARQAGGRIEVESMSGAGSTILLDFPISASSSAPRAPLSPHT